MTTTTTTLTTDERIAKEDAEDKAARKIAGREYEEALRSGDEAAIAATLKALASCY